MRVLHILPSLRPDGGERIAVYIASRIDRRRFDPALVSINAPVRSDLEHALAGAGVQVWYLGKDGPGFDWRMYSKMQRVFRAFRPEIVHTHMQVLRYAFPSMLLHKPRLMLHTVHNLAEHELEWRGRALQRVAYRCGVKPIGVAHEVARSVERLYNRSCQVIWNCVPTKLYRHPQIGRADWRAQNGFGQDDVLFVCVARLAPQKNHLLLLHAFARGPAADERARLLLVGAGPLLPRLQAEAKRLGLADKVRFLGSRTDIPDLLGAMDVFVLSSDWEGAPVALMEAMAAGLPVIATAVGGVPESFQDQKEGFLLRPGDASGITDAMMLLLRSGDARRSMGVAASARAQEKFDVAKMVRAYEDLYERALVPDCLPAAAQANPHPR